MFRRKPRVELPGVLIVADDLSGASDAAAGFLSSGRTIRVERATADAPGNAEVLAISTNTRDLAAISVENAMRPALERLRDLPTPIVVKKVDSTLRGNLGAELELVRAACDPELVVVAPAFPAQGRRVHDGHLHLDAGGAGAPRAITEAFALAHAELATVSLLTLREAAREAELDTALRTARVAVVDTELDSDLDAIVAAVLHTKRRVLWVGSGGLTAALARALPAPHARPQPPVRGPTGPILVVVGSASEHSHRQADALEGLGNLRSRRIEPDELLAPEGLRRLRPELKASLLAGYDISVELTGPDVPPLTKQLELTLAALVAPLLSAGCGLVLTGGATAEAVLERASVASFELLEEVAPGIPLGYASDEQLSIVTKAGAFGDDLALRAAVELLRARRNGAEAPRLPTEGRR